MYSAWVLAYMKMGNFRKIVCTRNAKSHDDVIANFF